MDGPIDRRTPPTEFLPALPSERRRSDAAPPTWRIGWLIGVLTFLVLIVSGLPDRLLTNWAYAVENGKIQANEDGLARVHEVSNAFRMVANVARSGVVHISVLESREELEALLRKSHRDFSDADIQRLLDDPQRLPAGTGSGILIDADGYILTNNHVVGGRTGIKVELYDNREYDATLVAADDKSDLAVIRIYAPDLQPLKFGDSDAMEVGDWVMAAGAPFGLTQTFTHGIISAKGRHSVPGVPILYQDFLQTDASINPGNSGGPLLNLRGEVIGVNTAIATKGDSVNAGVAFTIPGNMAKRIARELIETGKVARGWLGIQMSEIDAADAALFGMERSKGVLIDAVLADTPADAAGLQVEDVITKLNGRPVRDMGTLRSVVAEALPGTKMSFTIMRGGEQQTIDVTLARQPDDFGRTGQAIARSAVPVPEFGVLGRSLRPSIAALPRLKPQFDRYDRGVVITGFASDDSPLAKRVKPGEVIVAVNGRPVETVAELDRAIDTAQRPMVDVVVLDMAGETREIQVRKQEQE